MQLSIRYIIVSYGSEVIDFFLFTLDMLYETNKNLTLFSCIFFSINFKPFQCQNSNTKIIEVRNGTG